MATPEGTEKYFKRLAHKNIPQHSINVLGETYFQVSRIGFGGYRVNHNSIEHAKALRYSLLNGFNLIDTSSNYTDGGSEMLIGTLLEEMNDRGELKRDEVVVVSKVGYVQGENMKVVQENERFGHPFADMVKYMDGCWHCIHPDFLQDQFSRTLERLNLPWLDVYLLHNPEYFLSNAKKQGEMQLSEARDEYYKRIQKAFEWMEEKVAEGKIKSYGISSNTFPNSANDFEFTSLEKVIEVANFVASKNYFQVIQFPFNLFETGACFEKNQGNGQKTVFEFATKQKIGMLVNRPLNAMTGDGMVRLASFRESNSEENEKLFTKRLREVEELEEHFRKEFFEKIPEDVPKQNLQTVFSMAQQFSNALESFQSWEQWDHVHQNMIMPRSYSYLSHLNEKMKEEANWQSWSKAYGQTLVNFLGTISLHYENRAQKRSKEISDKLDNSSELLSSSETLSQKALRVLLSLEEISCVLLGMRKIPYVEDAFAALKDAQIPNTKEVLLEMES